MTDPWPITCHVELTAAEIAQATSAAMRAHRRPGGASWPTVAVNVGIGFVLAVLLVMNGSVRPQQGGLIASCGCLACWAAVTFQGRRWRRLAVQNTHRRWEAIGRRYEMTLDASGVRWSVPGYATVIGWACIERVEVRSGLIWLRTPWDSVEVLPERCLPPPWQADRLATLVSESAEAARAAESFG